MDRIIFLLPLIIFVLGCFGLLNIFVKKFVEDIDTKEKQGDEFQ